MNKICTKALDKLYPIAEKFMSIQGEGTYVGTPMKFLRLAGCSVGGKNARCKTALGFGFDCDTNYKASENMSVAAIIHWIGDQNHLCITGGEPFDHDLVPLLSELFNNTKVKIHIETSGTKPPPAYIGIKFDGRQVWVTLSPKFGWLSIWTERANELKLLVENGSSKEKMNLIVESFFGRSNLFVQPIWDENYQKNLEDAMDFCYKNQEMGVSLSVQTHKYLKLR